MAFYDSFYSFYKQSHAKTKTKKKFCSTFSSLLVCHWLLSHKAPLTDPAVLVKAAETPSTVGLIKTALFLPAKQPRSTRICWWREEVERWAETFQSETGHSPVPRQEWIPPFVQIFAYTTLGIPSCAKKKKRELCECWDHNNLRFSSGAHLSSLFQLRFSLSVEEDKCWGAEEVKLGQWMEQWEVKRVLAAPVETCQTSCSSPVCFLEEQK